MCPVGEVASPCHRKAVQFSLAFTRYRDVAKWIRHEALTLVVVVQFHPSLPRVVTGCKLLSAVLSFNRLQTVERGSIVPSALRPLVCKL